MRSIAIALLLTCLFTPRAWADGAPAVDDTCVLYLDFNDNFGTTYLDQSQYHNNGTRTDATQANGIEQLGLSFDGTGDYVDCGDSTDMDFGSGGFTLEAWIYINTLAIARSIIIKDDAAVERQFILQTNSVNNDEIDFIVFSSDTKFKRIQTSTNVLTASQWQHLLTTSNGSGTLKVYVNGVDVSGTISGTGDGSVQATSSNLIIGADDQAIKSKFFDGIIDEVRIYSRVLSAQEIKDSYDRFSGQTN